MEKMEKMETKIQKNEDCFFRLIVDSVDCTLRQSNLRNANSFFLHLRRYNCNVPAADGIG